MKRDSAAIIFRTVVFAGAMLGAPACSKKPAPVAPGQPTANQPAGGETMKMEGDKKPATAGDHGDPCADPCAGDPCGGGERPRGNDEDGGGGMGRGFLLS
jgi:hypothetical protein